jgi:hypothetical protein
MLCMKRIIWKKMLVFPAFWVIYHLYAACPLPVPLYGTWADNRGDTFSFFEDGTFNARVKDGGFTIDIEGSYSVLLNALTLSVNDGTRMVTEWDIRGNMLYLNWTNEDGAPIAMTLYKISN